MIANDKILAYDRSVVLVGVAPVKISPVLIEQISKETELKIGGRLFSDELSERVAQLQAMLPCSSIIWGRS